MKYQIVVLLSLLCIFDEIYGDCGCLKCNKHLQVVSPPSLPYQVIVNAGHGGTLGSLGPLPPLGLLAPYEQKPFPYQQGAYIPLLNPGAHQVNPLFNSHCPPIFAYKYQLQAPAPAPPAVPAPLTGLIARPDRIVVHQGNCPVYTGHDAGCHPSTRLPCHSIFPEGYYGKSLKNNVHHDAPLCSCRYDHGTRKKRDLPILKQSVGFLINLLPMFLRYPLQETLKSFKYNQKVQNTPKMLTSKRIMPYHYLKIQPKSSVTFLEKLQKLNHRKRRSLVFDGDGLRLPFLQVTDIENHLVDTESEERENSEEEEDNDDDDDDDEENEEVVGAERKQYLQPLNFNQLVPHNPIFYLLNAPIRFLHQFHKFGKQFSPVFKSVPHVVINSRKYIRNLGKHFKNDVLNFASNLIGDFDEFEVHNNYNFMRPRRYKRSLESYQPEYSLVFGNKTEENVRKKRYILKVVDEDEVEQYLREKLGGFVEPPEKPKKKKIKDPNKKRLVVEQLAPKVIIDNNGRSFVEINGVKRPLILNKKSHKGEEEKTKDKDEKSEETEDVKDKINSIISQAKERVSQQSPNVGVQQNVPQQMIKDRINQILTEIQNLINLDFDKYSVIHSDLCKLESFKELLVNEWKKHLMENKCNDMSSKIRLLDDFKELQILRDKAVEDIAVALSTDSNFMTKKLIKILVRLQKLQCIIYRVVEDFGEKIKMGTEFELKKEIKYVDYLAGLHFIIGRTKHDLEMDLKRERDIALKNEMEILENLRKILEENKDCPQNLYEQAQLLWEIKNIDRLQKDTIAEMNEKISRNQKVRKELKILFDLLRQLENCEEKQRKLFKIETETEQPEILNFNEKENQDDMRSKHVSKHHRVKGKRSRNRVESTAYRSRKFPHKTIIEDKKPIRLVSNGYTMTAYKVSDGFD